MHRPAVTVHDLERRHQALLDMRRYLARQEQEFDEQRRGLNAFVIRYLAELAPLYRELGQLDAQLRQTTQALIAGLIRQGIELTHPAEHAQSASAATHLPQAQMPAPSQLARQQGLPPSTPLPPVPVGGDIGQWAPPTLKMLYRRCALRIHPDRAANDSERAEREQQMMQVNAAYAAGERWRLEAMLLAAGEEPAKVTGGNAEALRNWLAHCEHLVQERLRVVNEFRAALAGNAMHKLWSSAVQAESKGIDLVTVMAAKVRAQIDERRKELYIGQRLKPESSLTRAFLHQRMGRMGLGVAAAAH